MQTVRLNTSTRLFVTEIRLHSNNTSSAAQHVDMFTLHTLITNYSLILKKDFVAGFPELSANDYKIKYFQL